MSRTGEIQMSAIKATADDRSDSYTALNLGMTYAVTERVVYAEANDAGVWGNRRCPRGT